MGALTHGPAAPTHAPVRGRYAPVARTTPLMTAMARIHAGAGAPSLRALARSAEAAGRFSHSALHNALTGRRVPAEDVLTAFAEACGAAPDATTGLLDARRRVLNGPARPQPVLYTGCLDHLAEPDPEYDAEGRRWPWLPRCPSPTGTRSNCTTKQKPITITGTPGFTNSPTPNSAAYRNDTRCLEPGGTCVLKSARSPHVPDPCAAATQHPVPFDARPSDTPGADRHLMALVHHARPR